jgi:SAM-dependent methyltransferase
MAFRLIGNDCSEVRINWVLQQLKGLPKGASILDAGAGERVFKNHCSHLEYVSQDFAQ